MIQSDFWCRRGRTRNLVGKKMRRRVEWISAGAPVVMATDGGFPSRPVPCWRPQNSHQLFQPFWIFFLPFRGCLDSHFSLVGWPLISGQDPRQKEKRPPSRHPFWPPIGPWMRLPLTLLLMAISVHRKHGPEIEIDTTGPKDIPDRVGQRTPESLPPAGAQENGSPADGSLRTPCWFFWTGTRETLRLVVLPPSTKTHRFSPEYFPFSPALRQPI